MNELITQNQNQTQTTSASDKKIFEFFKELKDLPEQKRKEFFEFCKVNNLNPFLKEAYILKFNDKEKGVGSYEIVTSYTVLTERVLKSGLCEYFEFSQIKEYKNPIRGEVDSIIEIRVKRKDFSKEVIFTAYFSSMKKETRSWKLFPEQMFMKSAFAAMARYYFEDVVKGAYIVEELSTDDVQIIEPEKTINQENVNSQNVIHENANNKNTVYENKSTTTKQNGNGNGSSDINIFKEAFAYRRMVGTDWESMFRKDFEDKFPIEEIEKAIKYVHKKS